MRKKKTKKSQNLWNLFLFLTSQGVSVPVCTRLTSEHPLLDNFLCHFADLSKKTVVVETT